MGCWEARWSDRGSKAGSWPWDCEYAHSRWLWILGKDQMLRVMCFYLLSFIEASTIYALVISLSQLPFPLESHLQCAFCIPASGWARGGEVSAWSLCEMGALFGGKGKSLENMAQGIWAPSMEGGLAVAISAQTHVQPLLFCSTFWGWVNNKPRAGAAFPSWPAFIEFFLRVTHYHYTNVLPFKKVLIYFLEQVYKMLWTASYRSLGVGGRGCHLLSYLEVEINRAGIPVLFPHCPMPPFFFLISQKLHLFFIIWVSLAPAMQGWVKVDGC
jgi:hypothetical protein